jgi:hypothetical protein
MSSNDWRQKKEDVEEQKEEAKIIGYQRATTIYTREKALMRASSCNSSIGPLSELLGWMSTSYLYRNLKSGMAHQSTRSFGSDSFSPLVNLGILDQRAKKRSIHALVKRFTVHQGACFCMRVSKFSLQKRHAPPALA